MWTFYLTFLTFEKKRELQLVKFQKIEGGRGTKLIPIHLRQRKKKQIKAGKKTDMVEGYISYIGIRFKVQN